MIGSVDDYAILSMLLRGTAPGWGRSLRSTRHQSAAEWHRPSGYRSADPQGRADDVHTSLRCESPTTAYSPMTWGRVFWGRFCMWGHVSAPSLLVGEGNGVKVRDTSVGLKW